MVCISILRIFHFPKMIKTLSNHDPTIFYIHGLKSLFEVFVVLDKWCWFRVLIWDISLETLIFYLCTWDLLRVCYNRMLQCIIESIDWSFNNNLVSSLCIGYINHVHEKVHENEMMQLDIRMNWSFVGTHRYVET